jgi:predicted phosphoribosyltransferase
LAELVAFEIGDSAGTVIVEMADDEPGIERIARGDSLIGQARKRIDTALEMVRPTVEALGAQLGSLEVRPLGAPESVEVEFGVRLNAEAGAVIAKTETEGHFKITLHWSRA